MADTTKKVLSAGALFVIAVASALLMRADTPRERDESQLERMSVGTSRPARPISGSVGPHPGGDIPRPTPTTPPEQASTAEARSPQQLLAAIDRYRSRFAEDCVEKVSASTVLSTAQQEAVTKLFYESSPALPPAEALASVIGAEASDRLAQEWNLLSRTDQKREAALQQERVIELYRLAGKPLSPADAEALRSSALEAARQEGELISRMQANLVRRRLDLATSTGSPALADGPEFAQLRSALNEYLASRKDRLSRRIAAKNVDPERARELAAAYFDLDSLVESWAPGQAAAIDAAADRQFYSWALDLTDQQSEKLLEAEALLTAQVSGFLDAVGKSSTPLSNEQQLELSSSLKDIRDSATDLLRTTMDPFLNDVQRKRLARVEGTATSSKCVPPPVSFSESWTR